MKIKCMLDNKRYANKPQGREIGVITNRLEKSSTEINIEDLMNNLVKGCTFKPSLLIGKKETDWVNQQLFALDFDENTDIQSELNRCNELNILPVFGYTSFSHTEEHHKFRLVFCANEVITDYNIAKQLQLTLMNVFNNCDDKCKNLSRLYFGGKSIIYKGVDNLMDYKSVLDKYPTIKEKSDVGFSPRNSKDIGCITSTITWGKSPKTLNINKEDKEDKYYNIKALRDRNVEYLKNKINNPKIILENNQAFFDYIKSYDLGRLLELSYPTSFRCILHEDNNPSAGIFVNEEGTYIYHCFSCGVSYNIINLIEVLGNFKSRPKAYKFMRDIFNLEIMETEWQKEQKEILDENLRVLRNGELELNCPQTYKNIKRNIRYLEELIMIAKDNVYSDKFVDNDDNVIFFASNSYICKQLHLSQNSSVEVTKKNVLFTYHNLINKIADNNIPEEMLSKSQAISANSEDKNKKYRHVNYYSIPSFTTNLYKNIETQGIQWKDNGYTMQGVSREMFYRSEGESVANKLYPQYTHVYDKNQQQIVERTVTNNSQELTNKIVQIIFDILDKQLYVIEKEIAYILMKDEEINVGKRQAENQIKKSMKEIIDSYDLMRIRSNKQIKETLNVVENGYPFIIVKTQTLNNK